MNVVRTIIISLLLIIFSVGEILAIDFKEGNYEITNWMEIPGKGRSKEENQVQCLTENDLGWKMYRETPCKLLSESQSGNTLTWEVKCNEGGIDYISGTITYFGDSFNGTLIYRSAKGSNVKVGIRGKRIGNCSNKQQIKE